MRESREMRLEKYLFLLPKLSAGSQAVSLECCGEEGGLGAEYQDPFLHKKKPGTRLRLIQKADCVQTLYQWLTAYVLG